MRKKVDSRDVCKYVPVLWEDTSTGDLVWFRGSVSGDSTVLGPFTVMDVTNRVLCHKLTGMFSHWSEDLMRRKR